jgi:hypothetical protein
MADDKDPPKPQKPPPQPRKPNPVIEETRSDPARERENKAGSQTTAEILRETRGDVA